jgi:hypothetical protein
MNRKKVSIKNDASSINNKRGMARRAKRHSAHQQRQIADKELEVIYYRQLPPLFRRIYPKE